MRKIVLSLVFCGLLSQVIPAKGPDEGMWIPLLLKELNVADMKAKGLKLSAEDIYSINKSSLKDAIVSFGGFCTGEVISGQGLLLTNHHCGFGAVQSHSSPENDYLTDGFWAMNRSEELPNPGLTATFIVRIEDVTKAVLAGVTNEMGEEERESTVQANIAEIEAKAVEGTHFEAKIKPFFYGNEYYMYVTETFKDVRLVGAPPSSIGKFGGDTDNWMWPRHTGDFSLFRIYAGKDNKPAPYSEENIPYKPKKHLSISLKPKEKGNFTMVYGFPGRTQEYLTSYAIEHIMNISNPAKIALREAALEIIEKAMQKSDLLRIQYASKQARISNYHKKWLGENRGLRRLDAIEKKRQLERKFQDWTAREENRKAKYGNLLNEYKQVYNTLNPISLSLDYLNEAAFRIEAVLHAYRYSKLVSLSESEETPDNEIEAEAERLQQNAKGFFKDYDAYTDQQLCATLLKMYYDNIPRQVHPGIFREIETKFKGDFNAYAEYAFSKSIFGSEAKTDAFLAKYTRKKAKKLKKDPIYQLMRSVLMNFRENMSATYYAKQAELDILNRTYIAALREMLSDKKFYPDANSTLRLAFGQIDDYAPADGVHYHPFTTDEGLLEKHISGDKEFDLPPRLVQLLKDKDFGRYGQDGTLTVCFTASNHTTGGNSGSPVLDAEGHLIGTNFDRNWEGTMSDIMYDPQRVRNIAVDIRYILFIVDKFAGASHLVDEMTILR